MKKHIPFAVKRPFAALFESILRHQISLPRFFHLVIGLLSVQLAYNEHMGKPKSVRYIRFLLYLNIKYTCTNDNGKQRFVLYIRNFVKTGLDLSGPVPR